MLQFTDNLRPSGILRFVGTDASKFLQGQTTCHLDELGDDNALLGAFCNPKGRMKTTFLLVKAADDDYLMLMSADQCDYIQTELAPYIAFFKAEIEQVSDRKVIGVMDTDQPAVTVAEPNYAVSREGEHIAITLPDQRTMMIVPADSTLDAQRYQEAELPWDAADIEAGLVWIDAQSREQFLPHDVNFPGLGGVSYEKGCYTGQEIVARMHYRGNPKYTAAVLVTDEADVPFESPLKSENADGKLKSIAQIISGPVTRGEQTLLLISAAKDITDQVEIKLSNPVERAILCKVKKTNVG